MYYKINGILLFRNSIRMWFETFSKSREPVWNNIKWSKSSTFFWHPFALCHNNAWIDEIVEMIELICKMSTISQVAKNKNYCLCISGIAFTGMKCLEIQGKKESIQGEDLILIVKYLISVMIGQSNIIKVD